jgi:hypothetical protein
MMMLMNDDDDVADDDAAADAVDGLSSPLSSVSAGLYLTTGRASVIICDVATRTTQSIILLPLNHWNHI